MSILKPLSVAMLAATLAACAAPMSASKPEPLNNEDWYQVRSETQVILFDDLQVFKDYLASGQAPSMRTLEEKDANGLEVVLALRAEDQGKPLDKGQIHQRQQNMVHQVHAIAPACQSPQGGAERRGQALPGQIHNPEQHRGQHQQHRKARHGGNPQKREHGKPGKQAFRRQAVLF